MFRRLREVNLQIRMNVLEMHRVPPQCVGGGRVSERDDEVETQASKPMLKSGRV